MAELVGSIIAIVGAVGGDGKGNGLSWGPVVMILVGLAKIADIAADWVLVGKLLGGDYCLDEVCGEGMLGKTGNMTNQSHTHNLVPNADGHGHVYKINHTHLVQSDGEPVDKVQGLETLTDFAIAAAVLGTFIELFGLVLTYKADGGDINSIFQKANLEKRPTRFYLSISRLCFDDLPTAVITIYLLVNAQFDTTELVVLFLSIGYSLLAIMVAFKECASFEGEAAATRDELKVDEKGKDQPGFSRGRPIKYK